MAERPAPLACRPHQVTIVDNLVRRRADEELGVQSLTPIVPLPERLTAWQEATGRTIGWEEIDVAEQYDALLALLRATQSDAVVHFAEQRSTPYSMKDSAHKRYTIDNNISATHNLLAAIVESGLDIHVVHLGTMGVYGYETAPVDLPEGYLQVSYPDRMGHPVERESRYPTRPGASIT